MRRTSILRIALLGIVLVCVAHETRVFGEQQPALAEAQYGSTADRLVRYVGVEDLGADSILELWQTLPLPIYMPEFSFSHAGATIAYRDVVRRVIVRFEDRLAVVAGKRMDVFAEVVGSPTYGIAVDYILPLTWAQFEQFNWSRSGVPTFAKLHVRNYTTSDTNVLENEIEHALMWLLLKGDGQLPWPSPVEWFRGNSVDLSNPDLVVGPLTDEDYAVIALALHLGAGANLRGIAASANRAPIAVAVSPSGTVRPGNAIRIDATGSHDPEGDQLAFALRQVQGFSDAEIRDSQTSAPTVVLPANGDFVFELTVRDPSGLQDVKLAHLYALAECPEPVPAKLQPGLTVAAYYITMWGRENYWAGFADANIGDRSIDLTLGSPLSHSLAGNYDCADPEVADWHIKMALENGINCFIIPNSWPSSENGPEKNFEEGLLRSRYIDRIGFFMMFNSEPWWNNPGLNAMISLNDLVTETVAYYCDHFFGHPSYTRIDGKPALMIYHAFIYREVAGMSALEKLVADVRNTAREHGFELYLIGDMMTTGGADEGVKLFDAITAYCILDAGPGWSHPGGIPTVLSPYSAMVSGLCARYEYYKTLCSRLGVDLIPPALNGFDNSLAFGIGYDSWQCVRSSPSSTLYRNLLQCASRYISTPSRMVVAGAWNEFHEGWILEPTVESGNEYLRQVVDVFGE
ncbi:MAG: glycoside hydrolase family 99-like domain-containing protein [Candidatus Bipolaricaulota bacterium]|nr:glycoside hydrolase family 99-like domain-containing protein [Candidatus Bipolaricaulota bacterium]